MGTLVPSWDRGTENQGGKFKIASDGTVSTLLIALTCGLVTSES